MTYSHAFSVLDKLNKREVKEEVKNSRTYNLDEELIDREVRRYEMDITKSWDRY